MSNGTSLIGHIVALSTRHPAIVVLVTALMTAGAGTYAARHFAMTANTADLMSPKLEWRQRDIELKAAFRQLDSLAMVVLDGKTPELADIAATRLTDALKAKPRLFKTVQQPQGGPFFERNGLLLQSLAEVRATTEGLVRAQPLLGSLAADPSLRGVLGALSGSLQGVKHGQMKLSDLEPEMAALADAFEKTVAGQPAYFTWRNS